MAKYESAAFEVLQRFANAWHDKYAKPASAGENRKPPSLTMRANGVAAVLTEPQLQAAVAEYVRMRTQVAELKAEREADVRVVAKAKAANDGAEDFGEGLDEWFTAATALFERFANRIAALDVQDADMDDLNDMIEEAW